VVTKHRPEGVIQVMTHPARSASRPAGL